MRTFFRFGTKLPITNRSLFAFERCCPKSYRCRSINPLLSNTLHTPTHCDPNNRSSATCVEAQSLLGSASHLHPFRRSRCNQRRIAGPPRFEVNRFFFFDKTTHEPKENVNDLNFMLNQRTACSRNIADENDRDEVEGEQKEQEIRVVIIR